MTESPKKVLIIEDDDALRSVLADALRAEYIDAIEAKDGEKGLMAAEQSLPHLILLDILMPRMDGRAVFRAIRAHKDLQHVPVSFLTNLSDLGSISEALGGEKADYIVKSDWSIDEIVRHVKEKLGTK
ncbi:MAG: response regulator [Patescibacteria group bacterium]